MSADQASTESVHTEVQIPTMDQYKEAVRTFDAAVCEALAVGQAASGRLPEPHIAYGTHVFARICGHATAMIRAAPKSRWVRSDSEFWDFSAIAGHARSIIEGYLLFHYITKTPPSPDEWLVRIKVVHLHDCTRRISVLGNLGATGDVEGLRLQAEELRNDLIKNPWFAAYSQKKQKNLLDGDGPTIAARTEILDELGIGRKHFRAHWDLLSQYAHLLTFTFSRLEANGRGSGLLNEVDLSYIHLYLSMCAEYLAACTDQIVEFFPDVAFVRNGINSKFSPGPNSNLPKHRKRKGRG